MAKNVTTIQATRNRFTADLISSRKNGRWQEMPVSASTWKTSYAAQCDYYTSYIQSREDWEFVGLCSEM